MRDEHHDSTRAGDWLAIPIAIDMLDAESSVGQESADFCHASEAQFAARHDLLAGIEKDVVALKAHSVMTDADQFEPALHRAVG